MALAQPATSRTRNLCTTSAPTPSFDQCNKLNFELAQAVKPQPSHIHFLDHGPYHKNKVSCPDLIIDTQLTNITLKRLEVNQSIPRYDDYCELIQLVDTREFLFYIDHLTKNTAII